MALIASLKEAHKRVGLVTHVFCLMPNHSHLLVQTPRANLSHCMRNINGG
ncbi:transposase [Psychromonas hadalis]